MLLTAHNIGPRFTRVEPLVARLRAKHGCLSSNRCGRKRRNSVDGVGEELRSTYSITSEVVMVCCLPTKLRTLVFTSGHNARSMCAAKFSRTSSNSPFNSIMPVGPKVSTGTSPLITAEYLGKVKTRSAKSLAHWSFSLAEEALINVGILK